MSGTSTVMLKYLVVFMIYDMYWLQVRIRDYQYSVY